MIITSLQCSICGRHYKLEDVEYNCPFDGGNLDVLLDYEHIKRQFSPIDIFSSSAASMWRYLPLIPVSDPGYADTPLHRVGWTPVYKPALLANTLQMESLWIKDESPNPSASFKDRASALVLVRAKQAGIKTVVVASTGNAGAATAAMAAALDMEAVILAPKSAPPAKIAQLLVYGARVFLVDGNYDDAFDLTLKAAHECDWYNRSTGYNPFTIEGKKTAAFEIWEQVLRRIKSNADLTIFIPVGDGNIISGIYKGFKDLQSLGWIEHIPRLIGVQAEGSAAIANAWQNNVDWITPVQAHTLADSISVNLPRDGRRALRAVRETLGCYLTVSDHEILQAIAVLGQAGIFSEPAGATAFAGLVKARANNIVEPSTPSLVLNTGSGLKDISACMQAVHAAPVIEPTIESLRMVI